MKPDNHLKFLETMNQSVIENNSRATDLVIPFMIDSAPFPPLPGEDGGGSPSDGFSDGFQILTYDNQGNILTMTDPEGEVTAYTYDAKGRRLTVADPLGNVSESVYNGRDLAA